MTKAHCKTKVGVAWCGCGVVETCSNKCCMPCSYYYATSEVYYTAYITYSGVHIVLIIYYLRETYPVPNHPARRSASRFRIETLLPKDAAGTGGGGGTTAIATLAFL